MADAIRVVSPEPHLTEDKTPNPIALLGSIEKQSVDCIVCHEEIKAGAKKCIHCDSFQDWRRFFGASSVVLTLLIALISVITTGGPVLKTLLTPNSDIRISVLDAGVSEIKVVVSNLGNRSAVFRSADLVAVHEVRSGVRSDEPLPLKLIGKTIPDPVLEPGKTKILEFSGWLAGAGAPLPRKEVGEKNCNWQITFDIIAFDHIPRNNTLSMKCPK